MCCKLSLLKKICKTHKKALCWNIFSKKFADLQPEKRVYARGVFSWILRTF